MVSDPRKPANEIAQHSLGETERYSLGADTYRFTGARNGSHPAGAARSGATGGRRSR